MSLLVVNGITDKIGPGDIVGAFTNEAQISGNQIGKIEINDNCAIVEIDEEIAESVAEIMNGNRISGRTVSIDINNQIKDKIKAIDSYYRKYSRLVNLERREEMNKHQLEIENLSPKDRQSKGGAILNLRGRDQGEALGGKFLVKFISQRQGKLLVETEISVGDLVMISKRDPLAKNNPKGTVVEVTKFSITVAFDNKPISFVYDKGLRMDLYANDITFQRMLETLSKIKSAQGSLARLRDKLLALDKVRYNQIKRINLHNQDLNKAQQRAVETALAAKDFFLIHGPPGTGKTVTAIEILEQEIERKKKVLATAASNTAVDNLVEGLIKKERRVLRIGHPARVDKLLREHTLDYLIEKNEKYQKAKALRYKAYDLVEDQKKYTHPNGRWRRGLSNQQIKRMADKGRGSRGVSSSKIKEMAKWIDLQGDIDQLFNQINFLEDEAVKELISNADVICSTNSTAGSKILDKENFDLVLIDEATQATEPSTLIPIVKADKFILIGDHQQLSPTVLSQKAEEEGLEKSLFERLLEEHGLEIKKMLRVQYRMSQRIMDFSSREFYKNSLETAETIKDISIFDLNLSQAVGNSPAEQVLICQDPIIFLDTKGMNAPEKSKNDSKSLYNRIEAELVMEIINQALSLGLNVNDLGVISPYKDQVKLIKSLTINNGVEVNTVDAFQGREKELILLSLVRSNQQDNIGFLRDVRRLNVSLTRAKRRLIIVGDSNTISSHPVYDKLIKFIQDKGYYYQL